ncbi:uroporphyrinogen-III synthase [Flagellimonas zhangzhouensis]|uniref:Uroporphyrinogen-III synthase n=1 Tax=Flagellimonas zhangzhouensis TaxID=1073328 RepID=A0A1H2UKE6_9FLAO|nr:uroporphyrinogen-III synthase [Allomuricauda zhangzhouensis]SDQ16617.1 uroporphyrinogen-III synthase [Allomuricauda zhangzhouensis]SDW56069.1 uroporphyrinogen-III synthase [Allomuricauda zhangzhouensis]
MKTVLSTKILTPAQKELFLNSGLGLVEYDALKIDFLNVEIPLDYSNYIFTSKNAVAAFLNQVKDVELSNFNTFCVGEKTKSLLEENGLKVIKMAENATELAKNIIINHKNEGFLFLCGNKRRDELPELLTKNNIQFKELEVYRTEVNPKAFQRNFDGILFFSPSGIRSFLLENKIGNSTLFCIGDTTANEAKKHSKNVIIANKPTVENVLVQVIKELSIQTDAERSRSN